MAYPLTLTCRTQSKQAHASRSQPEFVKKLRHLQQSDPVDPKELTRRLELCLIEQEVLAKHNIERTLRPVRSSSSRERTPPASSTPKKKARPITFHPDNLARNLEFQPKIDNASKGVPAVVTAPPSKRKSAPSLSQGSVKIYPEPPIPVVALKEKDLRTGHAPISQTQLPLQPRASPNEKPARMRMQPNGILGIDQSNPKLQQDGIAGIESLKKDRHRPTSLGPYVPQNAAKQLVQTATPNALKRETVHVLSLPVLDAYSNRSSVGTSPLPSPLPFLLPLSPLGASFSESIQAHQASGTEKTSIDSNSSVPKDGSGVSSAGYPSTTPSSVPPSSPPTDSVSSRRNDKRKTWNPRSIVAARKARDEVVDQQMNRNNFQDTALMAVASQRDKLIVKSIISPHEQAARTGGAVGTNRERRKTTAFESFPPSQSTPNLLESRFSSDEATTPVPVLVLPGEQRRSDWAQNDDEDVEKKEGLWKRLRRRTLNAEQLPQLEPETTGEHVLKKMPSHEHLRWKQLAMREKAITSAKKPKDGRVTVVNPPATHKKTDSLEVKTQKLQDQGSREHKIQERLVENIQQQLVQERGDKKGRNAEHRPEHQLHEKQVEQTKSESRNESRSDSHLPSNMVNKPPTAPPTVAIPATPRTPARSRKSSAAQPKVIQGELTHTSLPANLSSSTSPLTPLPEISDRKETSQDPSRPASPFTCPRPPPRIDSLQQKTSPLTSQMTPQSRNQPTPGRTISPSRDIYSTPINPVTPANPRTPSRDIYSTPLRSRTPSIPSKPMMGSDGHATVRSASSMSIIRPNSRSHTPIIPKYTYPTDKVSEYTYPNPSLGPFHRKTLSSASAGATNTGNNTTPKYRRISRFYSTAPSTPKPVNYEGVERIPGMTPESVLFLREQERLAAERFGAPGRNFSMPGLGLKRDTTEGLSEIGGNRAVPDADKTRKWKKQNWWKIWRL
jgi:hypothetical protein